jgi:hypothetical protein
MSSIRLVCFLAICSAIGAGTPAAQTLRQAALVHAEGAVYLDDELVVSLPDAIVLPDSATVRTVAGRATVALKHGGVLALNEHTVVRILANGIYNFNRVEIIEGIFRFDVERAGHEGTAVCRLRVYDGAAAVPLPSAIAVLRSGQAMGLSPTCEDMIPTVRFAPEQMDDFDRWSRRHTSR